MRKKLLRNWGLKLASLALAMVLWFVVVQIEDPSDTKTFSNITVKLTNTDLLRQENKVYEILEKTDVVSVTVQAPRSIIGQLRASDIVAEADVSKITDINTIAINCYVQNVEGVDSVRPNRDFVRLSVEDKRTRWVKVVYGTVGEVAESYIVSAVTPDQTQIEISGPKSVVDRVSTANVEIDVTGATTNLAANVVDIRLLDKEGNEVEQDNISKNVNYVRMVVEVLATKQVPVEVNYSGIPAEGYMVTGDAMCDPGQVTIAATTHVLSGIQKIVIPEESLIISGATGDVEEMINLKDYLPDNVKLADSGFNGKVTASVKIEPIVEKVLEVPVGNVSIVNVPEGVTAELPAERELYELKVSGLAEYVNGLRPAEMRGIIDVTAWMEARGITELSPGVHSIPITFGKSEEITLEEIDERVTVKIVR